VEFYDLKTCCFFFGFDDKGAKNGKALLL